MKNTILYIRVVYHLNLAKKLGKLKRYVQANKHAKLAHRLNNELQLLQLTKKRNNKNE